MGNWDRMVGEGEVKMEDMGKGEGACEVQIKCFL